MVRRVSLKRKFDANHNMASDYHEVDQGTGAHYYSADSNASQANVCLAADNNNYSTNTYIVTGYWDEETD